VFKQKRLFDEVAKQTARAQGRRPKAKDISSLDLDKGPQISIHMIAMLILVTFTNSWIIFTTTIPTILSIEKE
jgi:hypothetical protein